MGKGVHSNRGTGFRTLVLFLLVMAGYPVHTRGQAPVQNSAQSVLAPTATIYSSETEVCQGGSVTAYIYLSGDGPWSVEVSDKDSVYLSLSGISSPHPIQLSPQEDNVYRITRVVDRFGVTGTSFGQVALSVNPTTPVTILLARRAYLVSESGIPLTGDPAGGSFTGVGVSANRFYPRIATPVGSPHTITYTYYNQFGCASKDEAALHVLYGEGGVALLDGSDTVDNLCDDGRTYLIRGTNNDGLTGTFALKEAGSGAEVGGYITDEDPDDNEATLAPEGLQGSYDLEYRYGLEGLELVKTFRFSVNSLSEITIPGLPETVCSSDDPYPLVPSLSETDTAAVYLFTGPGVTGSLEEGFYYDPGDPGAVLGETEINLQYDASNGCSAGVSFTVTNRFSPEAGFTLSPVCLPADGGLVEFSNTSTDRDSVQSWQWDFGDPGSGPENGSTLENPSHFYENLGPVTISLTATAPNGCASVHAVDTILSDEPVADFIWLTDCFVPGKKITFLNASASGAAPVDTLIWTFRTADGGFLGMIGTSSDTVEIPFTVLDTYTVDLQVENSSGCRDAIRKEITLQPTYKLTAGYNEDFNNGDSGWLPVSADTSMSWTLGEPDFSGFQPVAGDDAWYTDLPPASGDYLEHSWVQSPCFDFRNSQNPLIKLDLMKSFVPGFDGAVLQYQESVTDGWKTIGSVGEGSNWYNAASLINLPGGSPTGWGLPLFNPDEEWVTATHDLEMLSGLPQVRLRIAVATGGTRQMGNQGFAFDNIFIGDRVRTSVLEHFTNSSSFLCADADDITDEFAASNSKSVIDIQYHTAFPGADPMNQNNPYPAATRVFNYGIQEVPFAILNGGTAPGTQYDFSGPGQMPSEEALKQASLDIPAFNVGLQVQWSDGDLEAAATVTCLADTFTSSIQLYVAVIETEVTAYTGLNQDTAFRNVVVDMLPSPTGTLLGNAWSAWMSESRTFNWSYPAFVEDPEDLAVVAFIQNRDTREFLQATADYRSPQVSSPDRRNSPADLRLYPNPATDRIYIEMAKGRNGKGTLWVTDLSGRTVDAMETVPGQTRYELDISRLSHGIYLVLWEEGGVIKGRGKLMKAR